MNTTLTREQIEDFRYQRPVRHETGVRVDPVDARIAVCDMAALYLDALARQPEPLTLEVAAKVCDMYAELRIQMDDSSYAGPMASAARARIFSAQSKAPL